MSMNALDRILAADPDGALRDQMLTRLEGVRQACEASLREPSTAETYRQHQQLRDACIAAKRVVRAIWRRTRPRETTHVVPKY